MRSSWLALICGLWATTTLAVSELKVEKFELGTTDHELSGIALYQGRVLLVSDDGSDTFIYRKSPLPKDRFGFEKEITLSKLKGYNAYYKDMAGVTALKKKHRRFDLEGLAVCGNDIYLANERVREVLMVENKKNLKRLPLKLRDVPAMMEGGANAGLEGIAIDCKRRHLFVAKERGPRMLLKYDLASGKLLKSGDFKGSDRQGQQVINPFTGKGLMTINSDIADLIYSEGFLYVLERNTYEIAKVNPETFEVVDRVSYYQTEASLYETGEPFGTAEALTVTKQQIVLGFDNNGSQLTHAATKKYGVTGNHGALIYFERPKGF